MSEPTVLHEWKTGTRGRRLVDVYGVLYMESTAPEGGPFKYRHLVEEETIADELARLAAENERLREALVNHTESPACPWCGDEVSDSSEEDFPPGEMETECGGCGQPVIVSTTLRIQRSARRALAGPGEPEG